MNKKKEQEEQKKNERCILLIYCTYCIILTAVTMRGRSLAWLAVVLDFGFFTNLILYVSQFRNYQFRAYFMTGLLQISIVLWSVSASELSATLPVLGVFTVVSGLYGIPELIYITAGSASFLNIYHILIARTADITSGDRRIQTVLQIMSVYTVSVIMYLMMKKKQEDKEQQMDVIESLKEAECSKDDFLANISHEIRTPINTICGMSEIVLRKELDDSVRADVFNIQLAGRSLQSVVSDVLDFSELQSGKMILAEETYNITSTMNDIINMSMAYKSEKRIELIVDCSADIPCGLYGDEQKIRRVIMNLVSNALKFTMEGGVSISVYTRKTDYGVNLIVCVRDTGIGMKEESLEKLFTSFSQVDTRRNRKEGGIGLGLAISQAMVEKMGGFITVQSEYGKGSRIQFTVPQEVTDHRPIIAVRSSENLNAAVYIDMEQFDRTEIRDEYGRMIHHMMTQLKVKSHFCRDLEELKRRMEREIYTHIFISVVEYEEDRAFFDKKAESVKIIVILDRTDDAKITNQKLFRLYKPFFILQIVMILNEDKMILNKDGDICHWGRFIAPDTNVLAVDDSLMNIRVLEGLLRPYKIKVSIAASGAEALEKIESMDYDLIFMDHMMPEMDGIETLHRIRAKEGNYFKKIPVVALTANAIGGMREVFLQEGFQDFMAKPIELSVLERVLRRNLPQEKLIRLEEAGENGLLSEKSSHTDLSLSYFNEQNGIKFCGGLENYIEVLQITSKDSQNSAQKIQSCFQDKDWKNYTIYVHALKSSMMNIGAEKLSGMAKELELAGSSGDTAFIMEHHDAMMQEFDRIRQMLRESRVLNPDTAAGQEHAAARQEDADGEKLDDVCLEQYIQEFEDAVYGFEEEKMKAIAKHLSVCSYQGHSLKEAMETVTYKIQMSDYMSALDFISGLKK